MLRLGSEEFTKGRTSFLDRDPGSLEFTAKVFVSVRFTGLGLPVLAQLDTGAAYSTLETELAESLGLFDGEGHRATLGTRQGTFSGRLERVPLVLVADEGKSLDIEATFFICRGWPGRTFIGYTGFLDRIRFALDPLTNSFYFGAVEQAGG
jgi:hypothetical protein